MKKIFFFIFFLIFIIYIIYIKFILPINFISYENYHGIVYLNGIYHSGDNIIPLNNFLSQIFSKEIRPSHGLVPIILYGYIYDIIDFNKFNIFFLQSFISIISYIFFSLFLYFIFNKDTKIFIINFLIFLTLPHQIKYGFSEDYYILGNFFISISLFLYLFFLKSEKKIIYNFSIFFSFFFFILSIYTRNLYLLYLPIFFFLTLYYIKYKNKYYKNKLLILFLGILGISIFLFNRFNVLIGLNKQFSSSNGGLYYLTVLEGLFPFYFFYFFLVGISLIFFIKRKEKYFLIILIMQYLIISFKFILIGRGLERHFLLLEPVLLLGSSIGIYILYIGINKYLELKYFNNIIIFSGLLFLLYQPLLYKNKIQELFSIQEEYIFINNNIDKIGNNFNLVIPGNKYMINYTFPLFLIKGKKYQLYTINGESQKSIPYFINNNDYSYDNNIFYLSTACYSSGNNKNDHLLKDGIREDCNYILKNYLLKTIIEKKISSKTYILPHFNTQLKKLKIGFYKIKGLKNGKDN